VFVDKCTTRLIYRGKRQFNWDQPHFENRDFCPRGRSTRSRRSHCGTVKIRRWQDGRPNPMSKRRMTVISPDRRAAAISRSRQPAPKPCWAMARSGATLRMKRYAPIVANSAKSRSAQGAQRRASDHHDEYPDKTFGSGASKITGALNFNDYGVAKRNNIPLYALNWTPRACAPMVCPLTKPARPRNQAHRPKAAKTPLRTRRNKLVPQEYVRPRPVRGAQKVHRRHHRPKAWPSWLAKTTRFRVWANPSKPPSPPKKAARA